ncbi:MAG: queuosine precursor transporter [Salinivirgaceae bacterium]
MFNSRKEILFTILTGFFVTNAVVGELIGGKLIMLGPLSLSIGIIPWPIVFLMTDIINEYFGKRGVRQLTFMTAGLVVYVFIILFLGILAKADPESPVTNAMFYGVFGQSLWIIAGSLAAFIVSQLVDIFVFWMIREKTGKRLIWLRSTGSTVISQLFDSFIVTGIAFWLPGKISFEKFINLALTGYTVKLVLAVALTPLIYVGHNLVHKYLGAENSELLIDEVAKEVLVPEDNPK